MTTNPFAQLILCAVLVVILWVVCGPLLRKISKPKPLPTLEDIMRADIDHAEREAYRYEQSAHADKMMARMYQERVDGLIEQLATRTNPDYPKKSFIQKTFPDFAPLPPEHFDPAFVRMRRKDLERAAGVGLDTWGINLGLRARIGQPDDAYRAELLALFDARYPGAV